MLVKQSKDKRIRQQYCQNELQIKILKFLFVRLLNFPVKLKKANKFLFVKAQYLLFRLKKLNTKTKIANRCVSTNRSRGVLSAYSISRLKFLELCRFGIVSGYKKAVW